MLGAIDPGQAGCIVFAKASGGIGAIKMPDTIHDIAAVFYELREVDPELFVWVEKVGTYMPGNSGPSAVKFAEHVGVLKGILASLHIPFDLVTPAVWEHWYIGKPNWPKIDKALPDKTKKKIRQDRKKERKNLIKAKSQMLYPDLKVTLALSDAIGIYRYGLAQQIN